MPRLFVLDGDQWIPDPEYVEPSAEEVAEWEERERYFPALPDDELDELAQVFHQEIDEFIRTRI